MPKDPAELLRDALSLPVEARAALIDSLLESLDVQVDDDAEAAWLQEIYRRLRQMDSGAVALIPWDEAQPVSGLDCSSDAQNPRTPPRGDGGSGGGDGLVCGAQSSSRRAVSERARTGDRTGFRALGQFPTFVFGTQYFASFRT
jgi:hypothetical protein